MAGEGYTFHHPGEADPPTGYNEVVSVVVDQLGAIADETSAGISDSEQTRLLAGNAALLNSLLVASGTQVTYGGGLYNDVVLDATTNLIIRNQKWPSGTPTANQILQTDGSGNLSWVDKPSGIPSNSEVITQTGSISAGIGIVMLDTTQGGDAAHIDVTPDPAGSQYNSGVAATTGGSSTGLTVNVVAGEGVNTATLTDGGVGYPNNRNVAVSTDGSGAGATVNFTDNVYGRCVSLTIHTAGSNYAIGDKITVDSEGDANAWTKVTSIDGGGGITGVENMGSGGVDSFWGSNYWTWLRAYTTADNAGTGLLLTLEVEAGVVTSANVATGSSAHAGTGYSYSESVTINFAPHRNLRPYLVGDRVRVSNVDYRCTAANTGNVPPNASYWAVDSTGHATLDVSSDGYIKSLSIANAGTHGYKIGDELLVSGGDGLAGFVIRQTENVVTIPWTSEDVLTVKVLDFVEPCNLKTHTSSVKIINNTNVADASDEYHFSQIGETVQLLRYNDSHWIVI